MEKRSNLERTKKCWNCFTRIMNEDTKCFSCGAKNGPPNVHGVGKKPIEWENYILGFIGLSAFCYVIYKALIEPNIK